MTESELIKDGFKLTIIDGIKTYFKLSKSGKTRFEMQEVPPCGWFSSKIKRIKKG